MLCKKQGLKSGKNLKNSLKNGRYEARYVDLVIPDIKRKSKMVSLHFWAIHWQYDPMLSEGITFTIYHNYSKIIS